jgi:hypothetical protein
VKPGAVKRYRAVAQEDVWGSGVACVASVLGLSYAQIAAKLAAKVPTRLATKVGGKPGRKPAGGAWLSADLLRRVLNEGFKNTGLVYELDQPFIGDPNSLETGAIVSLASGRYLMRAAAGWMDPADGKIRQRLPEKVLQALVLTPDSE